MFLYSPKIQVKAKSAGAPGRVAALPEIAVFYIEGEVPSDPSPPPIPALFPLICNPFNPIVANYLLLLGSESNYLLPPVPGSTKYSSDI